jgi:endonuclease/exonuclease/phosphatase family metal-dependent hydrolase
VATYNVRGFRDDVDRLVDAVHRLGPDVLLLQETGPRRTLRRFAATLGMEVAADPWSPLRRRVKDAVLVRPPWRLTVARQHRFPGSGLLYPRGVLVARADRPGASVWALSFHLGLRPAERTAHTELLLALAGGLAEAPVVLGGDLNASPDERAPARIAERYADAWVAAGEGDGATFPARAPAARIDYLFAGPGLRVTATRVAEEPAASDHRPVVADLRLDDDATVGSARGTAGVAEELHRDEEREGADREHERPEDAREEDLQEPPVDREHARASPSTSGAPMLPRVRAAAGGATAVR